MEYFETEETDNNPIFFEELTYKMDELNFIAGDEVVCPHEKCSKIYFIANGAIEIIIHN